MTITLATLPDATEQEIFDQVAKHLLTQMARSDRGPYCAYRGPDGLVCAAGCLISDSEYTPEFDENDEGSDWTQLIDRGLVPAQHGPFIRNLQIIHDDVEPPHWKFYLDNFANRHGLTKVSV